jgi:hypothetical protein
VGSEIGLFSFFSFIAIILFLNQIDGRLDRITNYLNNREFSLTKNEKLIRFVNGVLKAFCVLSFFLPLISMAVWVAGLIVGRPPGSEPVAGIAVALLAASFATFTLSVMGIKWNYFTFSRGSGILLVAAFLSLQAYKYVVLFMTITESFIGYSVVFCSSNGMIMLFILFLYSHNEGSSIVSIINMMPRGEPRDPERD